MSPDSVVPLKARDHRDLPGAERGGMRSAVMRLMRARVSRVGDRADLRPGAGQAGWLRDGA
jgi:hypothetical protein